MMRWAKAVSLLSAALTLASCTGNALLSSNRSSPPTAQDYLGDWTPVQLSDRFHWPAHFIVAQDGSGTHSSIQAAIQDLPGKEASTSRQFILIKPGVYRETVCAQDKAPFTLYAQGAPHEVTVVEGRYNAQPKKAGAIAHPCFPNTESTTVGTFASTSVAIFSDGAHLAGFTIANDAMEHVKLGQGYPPGVGDTGGPQAVALSLRGDRIQLAEMRLIGHQDTFFVDKTPAPMGRIFVTDSLIAGDVDFIFGGARLVIDNSLIISRYGRGAPGSGGYVLAPSAPPDETLGFLVTR
jgi:pectin methylesterase-like acyl-CoA thioesterase